MTLFEELNRRGLIAQATHPEELEQKMNKGGLVFYIGFDATADSLHVGHYLQLSIIRRMQQHGHMPILLLGTGTTMVGDPSGRTDMRKMLTIEEINHNADRFLRQMGRVVDISPDKAIVVRNGDWLLNLNYVELLRDVGVHFSVNKMLSYDCFKSRLERGLSFIEFNYMIMQSYDFLELYRRNGCTVQLGGNDQWSNIISGVELVRRVEGAEAYGMTFTLLTTKEGIKMGKTAKGAVWLDREKTTPYEFFQYWRNVDDADVIKCLKLITFVPVEEIEEMEKWEGSELNRAKEILAWELTRDIHSKEDADQALETARGLFSAGGDAENMPSTTLAEDDFTEGKISILDLLVKTRLAPSKAEARRLMQQRGITASLSGGEYAAMVDMAAAFTKDDLKKEIILKKGKKVFHRVVV
ncbi:MAG: tyrosine--tRNA ligase [Oscillospiraceae bacterium]|jgi:tyrosyl-tRNA synthetase|nr:tyrosine--tRNA ligase [Oscillospiraceae bacterium]